MHCTARHTGGRYGLHSVEMRTSLSGCIKTTVHSGYETTVAVDQIADSTRHLGPLHDTLLHSSPCRSFRMQELGRKPSFACLQPGKYRLRRKPAYIGLSQTTAPGHTSRCVDRTPFRIPTAPLGKVGFKFPTVPFMPTAGIDVCPQFTCEKISCATFLPRTAQIVASRRHVTVGRQTARTEDIAIVQRMPVRSGHTVCESTFGRSCQITSSTHTAEGAMVVIHQTIAIDKVDGTFYPAIGQIG